METEIAEKSLDEIGKRISEFIKTYIKNNQIKLPATKVSNVVNFLTIPNQEVKQDQLIEILCLTIELSDDLDTKTIAFEEEVIIFDSKANLYSCQINFAKEKSCWDCYANWPNRKLLPHRYFIQFGWRLLEKLAEKI